MGFSYVDCECHYISLLCICIYIYVYIYIYHIISMHYGMDPHFFHVYKGLVLVQRQEMVQKVMTPPNESRQQIWKFLGSNSRKKRKNGMDQTTPQCMVIYIFF